MSSMTPQARPGEVVAAQLAAYNARDLPALLATYAPDAQQRTFEGEVLACGRTQMEARFAARFAEPDLHAILLGRMAWGDKVIDAERVVRNFPEGRGTLEMLCVYQVAGELIRHAWFATGAKVMDGVPPPRVAKSPEAVVERQLAAYNARDLEAFLATYSPHIRVFDFPGTTPRIEGIAAMGEHYGTRTFTREGLNALILERAVLGCFVVDHERATSTGREPLEVVAIYEVRDGLIANVWFIDPRQPA